MYRRLTEQEIARRLSAAEGEVGDSYAWDSSLPTDFWDEEPRPAAVLIPLLVKENDWHVLFTLRTATLAEHSGQVAFPGGRADPEDSNPEQTALREAQEEIALAPEEVRVLGRLKKLRTITNYCITPVVGMIPWPYNFLLAQDEVSRVFTISLKWLAGRENYEIQMRDLPHPLSPVPVIYFRLYEDELLWGVSAQITLNLITSLGISYP
jgi:8-oxo-dGTP pyrophosphatase MutT (NUDIX family)